MFAIDIGYTIAKNRFRKIHDTNREFLHQSLNGSLFFFLLKQKSVTFPFIANRKMQLLTGAVKTNKNPDHHLPKNIICFSHLRWDFVFQRPQQLLTRLAKSFNVIYIEEPLFDAKGLPLYTYTERSRNLITIVPHLPPGLSPADVQAALRKLFDHFMENKDLKEHLFWYYTPMALEFSRKYSPEMTVYDCMDELSAFKFAPSELKHLEKELLQKADVVFTGGHSLFEAKKNQHNNIHSFPSSIDVAHFGKARAIHAKLKEQLNYQRPKLGFYGVIDERFDIDLIRNIATARPEWQIVLIGPVVKIDPLSLPDNKNIKYLGPKTYQELPDCIASWSIALIPFLINESTRYISPTKTPEYLAAGLPVISTPITDVINPYGNNNLVHICRNADEFIETIEKELKNVSKHKWIKQTDLFLSLNSWDKTVNDVQKVLLYTNKAKDNTLTSIA